MIQALSAKRYKENRPSFSGGGFLLFIRIRMISGSGYPLGTHGLFNLIEASGIDGEVKKGLQLLSPERYRPRMREILGSYVAVSAHCLLLTAAVP